MNKIYEEQLKINRSKISLNEDGPWKRKQRPTENPRPPQDPFAHYKPAKKQEKQKQPEEPKSELSTYTGTDLAWDAASLADPTGTVDLANAARYAYKGDYVGAAISALGAIPVIGNLATVGKLAKGAKSVAKTEDGVKWARRLYPKASSVVEVKPSAIKNTARQALPGNATTAAAALPQAAKSTALSKVRKTATAVGAGAVIATAAEKLLKKKKSKDGDDDDGSKKKMMLDPIPDIGLNIHRLSAFDPGDPAGYAKTTVSSRGGEQSHAGYHPYLTSPLNIDLQRRRSPYAMQKGLPESVEDNLKLKVKRSINNYLKSREGQKLDNHLNQVRKTLN